MHAQSESAPEHRAHAASSLHVASGLGLYLLTLAGEAMLGASTRWLLTYLGARAPSAEEAASVTDALQLLRSIDPSLSGPSGCHVLDEPLPEAYARGRTVLLSRGLIDSDALPAALAHELCHANSLDGRLT